MGLTTRFDKPFSSAKIAASTNTKVNSEAGEKPAQTRYCESCTRAVKRVVRESQDAYQLLLSQPNPRGVGRVGMIRLCQIGSLELVWHRSQINLTLSSWTGSLLSTGGQYVQETVSAAYLPRAAVLGRYAHGIQRL